MKIESTNIITTQNDDYRLCKALKQKYTTTELDCIVNIVYRNRHHPSDFVLKLLNAEYKSVDMDTIDFVMMWLREVFLAREVGMM